MNGADAASRTRCQLVIMRLGEGKIRFHIMAVLSGTPGVFRCCPAKQLFEAITVVVK